MNQTIQEKYDIAVDAIVESLAALNNGHAPTAVKILRESLDALTLNSNKPKILNLFL